MFEEGTREESLKILKTSIRNARELVVIDGYFFSIKKLNQTTRNFQEKKEKEINKVVNEIINILPNGLIKLLIVTKKSPYIEEVVNRFKQKIPMKCTIEIIVLSTIHDRVWIVNKEKYLILGTSFNGLGKSFSFLYTIRNEINKEKVAKYFRDRIKRNKVSNMDGTELNKANENKIFSFFRTGN